jgi:tRNA(fMet)-specific endonuclease VapC
MAIHVLDTDHLTLIQRGHPKVMVKYLATPREEIAASIASYEEQVRGRLAQIKQAKSIEKRCETYSFLLGTQKFYCTLRLLELNPEAEKIFEALRKVHRRSDQMDLRIAATVLSYDLTLVTRNTQDFISIENLRLDNWA